LLLCCVLWVYRADIRDFVVFQPTRGIEQFGLVCAKAAAIVSVPMLLLVLPLYVSGAQLYSCGDLRLRTTIAYLSDSPANEWCIAVLGCAAAGVGSILLSTLHSEAESQFAAQKTPSLTVGTYLQLVLSWMVVLVVLSVPTALYALSQTLPADNTLGLSKTALTVFNEFAVVAVYIMIVAVLPAVAVRLVQRVTQCEQADPMLTCQMLLLGRMVVNILVPIAIVIIFDNSCFAQWLRFWSPCADPERFEVTVSMTPSAPANLTQQTKIEVERYFGKLNYTHTVATHSEICEPSWPQNHHCSREVLAVVGDLIFRKCVFLSFLGPGATLLVSLPAVTRVLEGIWQRVLPGKDFIWYQGDVELAFILMFVEYILSLSFLLPLLLPLIAVGLALNTAVYHCAVEQLKLPVIRAARPSFKYLYISRAMGITFLILFYIDNDLHGKLLVCIGTPLSAIVGHIAAAYLRKSSHVTTSMRHLMEPLLGPEEEVLQHRGIWRNSSENDREPGACEMLEMERINHDFVDSVQSLLNAPAKSEA